MKLSVCMIVKNEEEMIGKCLVSIKDADEIIILDTGSTDRTPVIVKEFANHTSLNIKYIQNAYKWNDNFAEARNKALEYVTNDWVLTIDADEQIEQGGIAKIKMRLPQLDDPQTKVINVNVVGVDGKSKHLSPRLYKKDVRWKGAIHNFLNFVATKYLDVSVSYDYSPAHKQDPDRALRILQKEVKENRDIPRNLFYLGREYIYRKDYITALYWFERYVDTGKIWAPELAEVYFQMSVCFWFLNRGEDARKTCIKAIMINTNFKEAIEWMAKISWKKNQKRWEEFAKNASNEDVLFVRNTN
jgi:glycosyltransferase involved in cell wall biosynthesis